LDVEAPRALLVESEFVPLFQARRLARDVTDLLQFRADGADSTAPGTETSRVIGIHPFTGSAQQYAEESADPYRHRPTHCPQCQAQHSLTAHGFNSRTLVEAAAQFCQIFELEIAIRTGVGGDLLVSDTQGIAHLMKEAGDGIGADGDAELAKFLGDSGSGAAGPAQTRHGIAGRVVFQQAV
jgi:hypothetical protein